MTAMLICEVALCIALGVTCLLYWDLNNRVDSQIENMLDDIDAKIDEYVANRKHELIDSFEQEDSGTSEFNPEYYVADGYDFEVIDFIRAYDLGFCLGNVVKYVARAGKKSGEDELVALKKARWYLEHVISELEAV